MIKRTLPRSVEAGDPAYAGRDREVQDAAASDPDRNAQLRVRHSGSGGHRIDHPRLDPRIGGHSGRARQP